MNESRPSRSELRQFTHNVDLRDARRTGLENREGQLTIRGTAALAASFLLVLIQVSACARVKPESSGAQPVSSSEEQTPATRPPIEQSNPKPAEPLPKVTEQRPTATPQPKPVEPPQSKAAPSPQPKSPASAAPKPPEPSQPKQGAVPSPSGQERAAIVDLSSLEKRLRDTSAIGVFTKLALKNEVDDLLARFRAFHAGRGGTPLATLRDNFDLLVLKVISLLQDKDPPLARDISTSREALWSLLADPAKFKTLGFTGGKDETSHARLGRDSVHGRLGRPPFAGRG